jgi:hypothetical protein
VIFLDCSYESGVCPKDFDDLQIQPGKTPGGLKSKLPKDAVEEIINMIFLGCSFESGKILFTSLNSMS